MTSLSNWEWTGILAAVGSGSIYYTGIQSFFGNEILFIGVGAASGVGGYYIYRWLNGESTYETWVPRLALAGAAGAGAAALAAEVVLKRPMTSFWLMPLGATAGAAFVLRE